MNYFQAIILAIVEGITEFLPVSSTGHMILTAAAMGMEEDQFTKTFEVFIQFGAILSVVVLYYKRFLNINIEFYAKLLAAFIPTAVLGFLLDDFVDSLMANVLVVGVSLLIGGFLLIFVDSWFKDNEKQYGQLDFLKTSYIGFFQALAMIPGVSRSAATIIGGQALGLSRKSAAEFSFFLAVPTMFAASSYKLLKNYDTITADHLPILAVGSLVAFIVALLAIKFFIGFLTKYGFKVFGYYRIVLGAVIIALHLLDIPLSMF
jgi:undecaprenyl-diphosphatase